MTKIEPEILAKKIADSLTKKPQILRGVVGRLGSLPSPQTPTVGRESGKGVSV